LNAKSLNPIESHWQAFGNRKEGRKKAILAMASFFFFFVVMVRADKWPIGSLLAATLHVSFLTQFFSEIDEMQEGMLSTKNSEFPKPTMC